ncbi:Thiamine-monophosphate kinase [mine drainage metagenome]|uniref:Thiamine-monophosphate kinase n=1 Tax=mine drainage metagenome TaxID=410659 RepID=T1ARL9_9ZZZZ
MPLSEFELIERYFRGCGQRREDVIIGVGDDAAVLRCPAGAQLAVAVDTLVEDVHFPRAVPRNPSATGRSRSI